MRSTNVNDFTTITYINVFLYRYFQLYLYFIWSNKIYKVIFSLTHKNSDDKEYIIVTWTKPDDYDGQDLYLRYTIVTEKRQYWVGLEYPPREEVTPTYDDLGFKEYGPKY